MRGLGKRGRAHRGVTLLAGQTALLSRLQAIKLDDCSVQDRFSYSPASPPISTITGTRSDLNSQADRIVTVSDSGTVGGRS